MDKASMQKQFNISQQLRGKFESIKSSKVKISTSAEENVKISGIFRLLRYDVV